MAIGDVGAEKIICKLTENLYSIKKLFTKSLANTLDEC